MLFPYSHYYGIKRIAGLCTHSTCRSASGLLSCPSQPCPGCISAVAVLENKSVEQRTHRTMLLLLSVELRLESYKCYTFYGLTKEQRSSSSWQMGCNSNNSNLLRLASLYTTTDLEEEEESSGQLSEWVTHYSRATIWLIIVKKKNLQISYKICDFFYNWKKLKFFVEL